MCVCAFVCNAHLARPISPRTSERPTPPPPPPPPFLIQNAEPIIEERSTLCVRGCVGAFYAGQSPCSSSSSSSSSEPIVGPGFSCVLVCALALRRTNIACTRSGTHAGAHTVRMALIVWPINNTDAHTRAHAPPGFARNSARVEQL